MTSAADQTSSSGAAGCPAQDGIREDAGQRQQPDSGTDELQQHLHKLALLVKGKQKQIQAREEQLEEAKAALAAKASMVEGVLSRSSNVVHLNVGGTHISTSRRTLTLVQDSLLATMFGGAWDDRLDRDADGRFFLDFDPSLFLLLLNFLRTQDMGGPEAPLVELSVAAGQEEALLVLVNYLQLQRHVPLRFHETFSSARSSPYCSVSGSSAWRLAGGAKGKYAVAALAHNYYDVHAEAVLEVLRFGAVPRHRSDGAGASGSGPRPAAGGGASAPGRAPGAAAAGGGASAAADGEDDLLLNHPMFLGIVTRQQLEAVDQAKRVKKGGSNVTWQSTCFGWWTSRRHACHVEGGDSKMIGEVVLWAEGDTLLLTLDCRKHTPKAAARLSLTNTRTNVVKHLHIDSSRLQGCEESYVFIVGLAGRADEVRVHSVKHHGMKPQGEPTGPVAGGGAGGGGEPGLA